MVSMNSKSDGQELEWAEGSVADASKCVQVWARAAMHTPQCNK